MSNKKTKQTEKLVEKVETVEKVEKVVTTKKPRTPKATPTKTAPQSKVQVELNKLKESNLKLEMDYNSLTDLYNESLDGIRAYSNRYASLKNQVVLDEMMRQQFLDDVDALILTYNKSTWWSRLTKSIKVLKSLIKVIKYYKSAVQDGDWKNIESK